MRYLERHTTTVFAVSLLALYILSVVINLGTLEFAGEEPRRAMVSIEMLDSGNYIRPVQYGWNYYNKPPLFNWILAAMIWLTGSASELVLRLPSLIFYLLLSFFHYKISSNFFPKHIALLSAFFLLTCADVYTYGLAYGAEIDIFYSLIVYLQAISIFWFYTKQQYLKLYLASYLFCAIGFLTKAFPSLLFQGLTLVALSVYAQTFKVLFRWQHLAGILVLIVPIGCYFFLYSGYSSPQRFLINLLNEATLKSGVGERSYKLLDKSVIYPWLFFKMLLPWSLLLLLLLKRINYSVRENPLVWFSFLFIVFNLWVYWFTGQPKIRYVYMFVPFACTILVDIYYRFTERYPVLFDRLLKYLGYVFIFAFLAVIAVPFFSDTSIGWVIGLAAALLVLLFFYFRFPAKRIWWFIAGFMLVRLVYAAVFIPIQRRHIESYNDHALKAAQAINKNPVQYWADASSFPIAVNTTLFTYQVEVIKTPLTLPLEIPYYYYRNTGTIIRFDTLQGETPYFISFLPQVNGKEIDTIYAYFDKNLNQRVVFYKLKN
jgi:4-amino-4-deoxy-L-arabinose transferase-like glycosyltransferase